jgi:hypothetical protein
MTIKENLKRIKKVEGFLFWGFLSIASFLSFLNVDQIYSKLMLLFLFVFSYIPTAYNFINISGQIGEDWALGWNNLNDQIKNIVKNVLKWIIYIILAILTLIILIKLVIIALNDPIIKDTLKILSSIVVIVSGLVSVIYKSVKIKNENHN